MRKTYKRTNYTKRFKLKAVRACRYKTIRQVAKELDIEYQTLCLWNRNHRNKKSYKKTNSSYTKAFKERLVKLCKTDHSTYEVSKKFNVPFSTLHHWTRGYNMGNPGRKKNITDFDSPSYSKAQSDTKVYMLEELSFVPELIVCAKRGLVYKKMTQRDWN